MALGVIATGRASAAQRAYTCTHSASTLTFSDAHCTNPMGSPSFGHTLITTVNTEVAGTNERTAEETNASAKSILRSVVAGAEVEIDCAIVAATGKLTNQATWAEGKEIQITYSNCTLDKPPKKGCRIWHGGTITTEKLIATTESLAAGEVLFSPASPPKLAEFEIELCESSTLNGPHVVTGSLIAAASGATLTTTIPGVKLQGTLKFDGSKNTGLETSVTPERGGIGISPT
ncbi:MAG TPA: hypothetical protein VGI17_14875 [Solirubrobacterales bacterium]